MGSIDALSAGKPWNVPPLVVETARFVYQKGLETEGIFRISPSVSVVQEVKTAMTDKSSGSETSRFIRKFSSRKEITRGDENKYDTISSITEDPHVAAHILKDFLRKLDEPLFPVSVNAQLIAAVKEKDFNTKIKLYKQVMGKSISTSCRRVLSVIGFLGKNIVKHTSANKMSYQALGVVFGPCIIRLDPMQMIEMWDSRITEELFGNFGAIIEEIPGSEFEIVAKIVNVQEVKFEKDPPMTAKVTMLNKADMGEGAGKVDLQINVAFVGDEGAQKFELFCACAAKQAPIDPVRAKMRKAYYRPLESAAMLDTGTKVGVSLRYIFDWNTPTPPKRGPSPIPAPIPAPISTPVPAPLPRDVSPAPADKRPLPLPGGRPLPPPPRNPGGGGFTSSGGPSPSPAPSPAPVPRGPLPVPPRGNPLPTTTTSTPASLPPIPTSLPPPSSSTPVTKGEQKNNGRQDYKELLKTSNVIVMPFSICEPKSLEIIVDKWIPALMAMQVTAPIVLVGCEKEKRVEGGEGFVTEEQAKGLRVEFSTVEKYVEVSTVKYKGFRTLADAGLDAFLLDYHNKQQRRRVTEVPTPTLPNMPNMSPSHTSPSLPTPSTSPSLSSSSSAPGNFTNSGGGSRFGGSGSKIGGKGRGKEECLVM